MSTVLEKIVARKRLEVAASKDAIPLAMLEKELANAPKVVDFYGALIGIRQCV